MNLAEDEDGDSLTYWVQLDTNPCFCSEERMESGAIPPGELAASWTLPRPLSFEPGVEKTYYLQVWTNDGLDDSEKGLSLFKVSIPADGGDGDADADADSDGDGDGDGDSDGDGDADVLGDDDIAIEDTGCTSSSLGAGSTPGTGRFVMTLVVGLVAIRRRRRTTH